MTVEGQRPSIPSAPDALERAISVTENRTYPPRHEETIMRVNSLITPLLSALSVSETYTRSSTQINGQPQEDLWRRTLSYPVEVRRAGESDLPYFLYATQIVDKEGNSRVTFLEASTYAPDGILIATMRPDQQHGGIPLVRNAQSEIALQNELVEVEDLAKFLSEEAPRQAVAKGKISPHWMERWNMTDSIELPCSEGFPEKPGDGLYEIIQWNGIKRVCTVEEYEGKLRWNEDVHGEVQLEESRVAAWRLLGNILPEYYSREKYPTRYQGRTPTAATI